MQDLNKVANQFYLDDQHGRANKHEHVQDSCTLQVVHPMRSNWYAPYHSRRSMLARGCGYKPLDDKYYVEYLYYASWNDAGCPDVRQQAGQQAPEPDTCKRVTCGRYSADIRIRARRYHNRTSKLWMLLLRRRHRPDYFNGQRRLDRLRHNWSKP